jgi:menaquinone-dependent protoporphyrinogen IX oxidase
MRAVVFFAGRNSQSYPVAERIATQMARTGADVELHDVSNEFRADWGAFEAACVADSGELDHGGRELLAFAAYNRRRLARLSAACVWVDPAAASGQAPAKPASISLADFIRATGWKPTFLLRLPSVPTRQRYDAFLKLLPVKHGSRTVAATGGEVVDWTPVDRFASDVLIEAEHRQARRERKAA